MTKLEEYSLSIFGNPFQLTVDELVSSHERQRQYIAELTAERSASWRTATENAITQVRRQFETNHIELAKLKNMTLGEIAAFINDEGTLP